MTDFTKILNQKLKADMLAAAELMERAARVFAESFPGPMPDWVVQMSEQAQTLRVDTETLLDK